jgi:exonuclease SbcC
MENSLILFRSEIEKQKLEKLEEIRNKIGEYYNSDKKIEELKTQIKKEKQKLKEIFLKKEKTEFKIKQIKNGTSYQELKEVEAKSSENEEKNQKMISDYLTHFSNLDKALKKYKKKTLKENEEVIEKYEQDPVEALIEDDDLKIIEILQKMKKELPKLEIKDKKAKKTEKIIDTTTKEYLEEKRKEINEIKEEAGVLKKRRQTNTALMNLKEYESHFKATQEDEKVQEEKIKAVEADLERISLRLIKQQIRDSIKELDPYTTLVIE